MARAAAQSTKPSEAECKDVCDATLDEERREHQIELQSALDRTQAANARASKAEQQRKASELKAETALLKTESKRALPNQVGNRG